MVGSPVGVERVLRGEYVGDGGAVEDEEVVDVGDVGGVVFGFVVLSNLSHLSNAAATAVTWASLLRCEAAAATWGREGEWRVVLGRVLRELEVMYH